MPHVVSEGRKPSKSPNELSKYRHIMHIRCAHPALLVHCNFTALYRQICTVVRYGHIADLFFTARAHVNHIYVRTSSSTCERRRG